MKKTHISVESARKIALDSQLLNGRAKLPQGKEGVARIIEKLGYIQIDTLAVINRSHHHTLWTRFPDYDEKMLHELQVMDRRVFEYWGHATSYMPMSEYRFCLPRMRNFENTNDKWVRKIFKEYSHLMQPILDRIRNEGPLSSKDFTSKSGVKSEGQWSIQPARAALTLLFWKGDLMITERRKFQKIYDVTERVLPEGLDLSYPDDDELGQFFVRRALQAFGVAQEKEIRLFMQPEIMRDSHFQAAGKEVISKTLTDLIDTGEVIPVNLKGDPDTDYFALSETIENSDKIAQKATTVSLLSPFDNLIIQRDRTRCLFGFDYTLECYVPAVKRKYGYYVLPILWDEKLVGRLDPKADRKKRTLFIRNLVFEPDFRVSDDVLSAFAGALVDLARFNQCKDIVLEKVSPARIKTALESLLE